MTDAPPMGDPRKGPTWCGICQRFLSWKDAVLSEEFGDYGSILSSEILCPRCAGGAKTGSEGDTA